MLKIIYEKWKRVPELKEIKVSSLGNVKINGHKQTLKVNQRGYYCFKYKNKFYLVHRLVAKTFLKHDLTPKDTIDHVDNNRRNNNVSNLEIVSRDENQRRAIDNLIKLSEANPSFLSPNTDVFNLKDGVKITDGRVVYNTIQKACNAIVNQTSLTKTQVFLDIFNVVVFEQKGKYPWKLVTK